MKLYQFIFSLIVVFLSYSNSIYGQFDCSVNASTFSVTVNPTPAAPVAGSNSTVCSGQTLSLTASSTGTTYSWSGPNSFTSTSQNPIIGGVTTLASGTYSVTATTSGCTSTAELQVLRSIKLLMLLRQAVILLYVPEQL